MGYSYKLGVIGCGNMAEAIVSRACGTVLKASEIQVFDSDSAKLAALSSKYGVKAAYSNSELVSSCEYVLFAVKPQSLGGLNIGNAAINCLISIMAGVKIATLKANFNVSRIVRVMPNTPCSVGVGMCALTFDGCTEKDKLFAKGLFNATGKTIELDESKFDAVTAVSGSGPAYVYYFIEAMTNGGVQEGLTYEESKTLAIQTVKGAAELAERSDIELSVLIDRVCSKGGTTIEAVNYLKEKDVGAIVCEAVRRCAEKSRELGKR